MSRKMIHSLLRLVVLSIFITVLFPVDSFSWRNPELLVELNETTFVKQDFIDWWQIWKEEDTPFPDGPDDFIDWMLLAQEAKNMQLYDQPVYRNKVSIYLRVRSLMQLKQEEVDSRISKPTREDLWPLYQEKYLPRFNLKLLSVNAEDLLPTITAALKLPDVTIESVADQVGLLDTESYLPETGLMGPSRIPSPLLAALQMAIPGETGGPVTFNGYTYYFQVIARDDGTAEDFEALREGLAKQWQKQQVGLLSSSLIEDLKAKYQVDVDAELVAKIGLDPLEPELASKIAVKIDDIDVTAQSIQESLVKDFKLRYGGKDVQEEMLSAVRERVINDMLNQTLTAKEAMARHYEERDPLRKNYQFYCQNRLIKELEQQMVQTQTEITEADIENAYQRDITSFTRKALVELSMVTTREEKLARVVEAQLLKGEDFNVAVELLAPLGVNVEKIPMEHLPEPVRVAVLDMSAGQVSRMIPVGEELFFVKLINPAQAEVLPLGKVRNQVETNLKRQRYQEARSELVAQLRERSQIEVKSKAWKQLVAQFNEGEL